ncbi:Tripartite-type tricarboxylate transporter, receptor component TctC [Thalassobacillus cyri]|uniref:Tripartite-type tricarboxylate transporter, receptor component TctC n=1 Tax=Thalassobacillus cyri TaxID=571932 RepID=A0A1H4AG30_9BACI|nr:tripartite tricarboxylate transporter substrate binding protein [Thalassobacillus cyri]SEA34494.1 Tripartite-type tricarboxylate transporter, receptor component TctC [Thalassobacillus cyri]
MFKKYLYVMVLGVILVLTACSNTTAQEEEAYPKKSIDLIVSYAAGGGTDTGARILQPYLEEELGVSVNIINKPGGAGWVGWADLANAEPDGYTIGYLNSPNIITGYLDPKFNRSQNLESFQPIANHVLDPGVIAIKPNDDRFSNIKELVEYAQNNKITATTSGVGSNDHMAILKLNKFYDTNITPVHTKGAAEGSAQVLGDHVDVFVAKVGEAANLHKSGELKAVAVMTEERSPFIEEVPTMEESGYPEVTSRSARGIGAPAGLSEEKLEILSEAFKKAIENEKQVKEMEAQGLQVKHLGPEEYKTMLKEDESSVKDLSGLLGY